MIKNDAQLARAEKQLAEMSQLILDLRLKYTNRDRELRLAPLYKQRHMLETETNEYKQLSEMSLDEAVKGPLDKGVLIENIGELLAKLRIAADMTQAELADRLGWDQPNVSRFESANYSGQSIAKIAEYLDALGVWLHVRPSTTEIPVIVKYTNSLLQGVNFSSTSAEATQPIKCVRWHVADSQSQMWVMQREETPHPSIELARDLHRQLSTDWDFPTTASLSE